MHSCPHGQVGPATNTVFWEEKRSRTVLRDASKRSALDELGRSVLTVWEYELRDSESVKNQMAHFLGKRTTSALAKDE